MALNFQPPNIQKTPSRGEALLNPINSAIQSLPALLAQYENSRGEQELRRLEMELKKRELLSKFGTGVAENIFPGQVTSAPPVDAGPEEQMYGLEATQPAFTDETEEQKLRRLGTEAYGKLNQPGYGSYVIGADGKPQFLALPQGFRPSPGVPMPTPIINPEGEQVGTTMGKPTVLPQPKSGITGKKEVAQALSLYETARDGLISGLEASKTGPISGRLPAFTAKQQTAEGGVSAMAPVLKQLFRVSGEGVFTDKDQELLLNMVPTRKDLPEARKAKIENIDNIVKAKLGMGKPQGQAIPSPDDNIVDTQEEYDALPSGAIYIDSNGKKARKR